MARRRRNDGRGTPRLLPRPSSEVLPVNFYFPLPIRQEVRFSMGDRVDPAGVRHILGGYDNRVPAIYKLTREHAWDPLIFAKMMEHGELSICSTTLLYGAADELGLDHLGLAQEVRDKGGMGPFYSALLAKVAESDRTNPYRTLPSSDTFHLSVEELEATLHTGEGGWSADSSSADESRYRENAFNATGGDVDGIRHGGIGSDAYDGADDYAATKRDHL